MDWKIADVASGEIRDEEYRRAGPIVRSLVGRQVDGWQLDEARLGLRIDFSGGTTLKAVPMVEPEYRGKDAWALRTPGGKYLSVKCDGAIWLASGDEPCFRPDD